MFDYLDDAKKAHAAFCSNGDKGYADAAQVSASIAIAEQVQRLADAAEVQAQQFAKLTEQVRRVADKLNEIEIIEGKMHTSVIMRLGALDVDKQTE